MNKKIVICSFLVLSVILTGCSSKINSQNKKSTFVQEQSEQKEISKVDKIEVIDFHGSRRCFSCQTIEEFAKKTLEKFFQSELQDDKITFQTINVEETQNKEIVKKYQARGSSLFINVIRDGEDNISEDTQVWRLVKDEEAYEMYFKEKIENILK